jgi:hypothetical protein
MGIEEALAALNKGEWIRRKVWHPDYAIRGCNMGSNGKYSALISSIDLMYNLGNTHAPLKGDDLNQNNINEREYGKSDIKWRKCGLEYDVLCNDWEIGDSAFYATIVKRTEVENEERRKKAHEESCRMWGNPKFQRRVWDDYDGNSSHLEDDDE